MMRTLSFTVPAGAGAYAPEELYLNADNDKRSMPDVVGRLRLLVAALTATAIVEVDLLKPGAEPGLAASWRTAATTFNAAGLAALVELPNWVGVRIRVKSGGTAGVTDVDAAWHKSPEQ